jgi:hypothetical protein
LFPTAFTYCFKYVEQKLNQIQIAARLLCKKRANILKERLHECARMLFSSSWQLASNHVNHAVIGEGFYGHLIGVFYFFID